MGVSLDVFKVILSECCAKTGLGCLVDHLLHVVTYRDPVKGGKGVKRNIRLKETEGKWGLRRHISFRWAAQGGQTALLSQSRKNLWRYQT